MNLYRHLFSNSGRLCTPCPPDMNFVYCLLEPDFQKHNFLHRINNIFSKSNMNWGPSQKWLYILCSAFLICVYLFINNNAVH